MPTMYDYVNAKCPYFLGNTKNKITCEGITDDCITAIEFNSQKQKKLHRSIFCDAKYMNCEIAQMLTKKYDE